MPKSDRLFDLIQILRQHRLPVSGQKLAAEAGVSLRTIRRDIASLQAMGVSVDGEPGVGYVLSPGSWLPPLTFTKEELHALTIGLQWVTDQTDEGLIQAAKNALAKIAAVLPAHLSQELYENGFHVEGCRLPPFMEMSNLRLAMRDQVKVRIRYLDSKGLTSDRVVWPLSIGFIGNNRYIACWCELREDFRIFRVDRIVEAALMADRYPGQRRTLVRQWRLQQGDGDKF